MKLFNLLGKNIFLFFLGGGSNVLFSDFGFRGLVLCLRNREIVELSPEFFELVLECQMLSSFRMQKNVIETFHHFSPFRNGWWCSYGKCGNPSGEIKITFFLRKFFEFLSKNGKKFPLLFQLSYRHSLFHEHPELRGRFSCGRWNFLFPKTSKTYWTGSLFFRETKENTTMGNDRRKLFLKIP